MRILVVRLGAMGDVIHTLPAVARLKASFPASHLTWVIEPRWAPLLEQNPFVDHILPFNRRSLRSVRQAWLSLREQKFDLAVDFQGLMKSALVASASGATRIIGYGRKHLREKAASFLYTESVSVDAVHVVDQHYELAAACGAHADAKRFALPQGVEEGELPKEEFVLACPFAGWPSKEWPIERYEQLGSELQRRGLALVLNGHTAVHVANTHTHTSSIAGLIYATRRAKAVVGLDSGPLHLAAALGKPGVAIFGPTDPCRNGPYGGTIRVLRAPNAVTSYKRRIEADPSMLAITPQMVLDALEPSL